MFGRKPLFRKKKKKILKETTPCDQLLSVEFGLGSGLDLLTRFRTEEHWKTEVDIWSDWPLVGIAEGHLDQECYQKKNIERYILKAPLVISDQTTFFFFLNTSSSLSYCLVSFSVRTQVVCGTCWIPAYFFLCVLASIFTTTCPYASWDASLSVNVEKRHSPSPQALLWRVTPLSGQRHRFRFLRI